MTTSGAARACAHSLRRRPRCRRSRGRRASDRTWHHLPHPCLTVTWTRGLRFASGLRALQVALAWCRVQESMRALPSLSPASPASAASEAARELRAAACRSDSNAPACNRAPPSTPPEPPGTRFLAVLVCRFSSRGAPALSLSWRSRDRLVVLRRDEEPPESEPSDRSRSAWHRSRSRLMRRSELDRLLHHSHAT